MAPGGLVYHVLNRSVGRIHLFRHDKDYAAFQRVILQAHERYPLRILAYCVLSTHWHFVVWPENDGEVTDFFRWLAHTHAMRWRVSHGTVGDGHLYRGRFKSFPVQTDEHLLTVCRYVERNALSAGLVKRAQNWRWSSLWARENGKGEMRAMLSPWPVRRPSDWTALVNEPITAKELQRVQTSLDRGRPLGSEDWIRRMADRLKLQHTLRDEGRPRKTAKSKARDEN